MSYLNINKENFSAEVLNSDRPVLLDFWASWCGPCQMIAPAIEAIAEEQPNIKVGKVNVDKEPELAAQFGIMSIPSLLVIKNGQLVNKSVGFKSKDEILAML